MSLATIITVLRAFENSRHNVATEEGGITSEKETKKKLLSR